MQRIGKPYFGRLFVGIRKPKNPILGTEFCGTIESVGKDVRGFKQGDVVFGATGAGFGCYAEFMCMPESGFVSIKPINLSAAEAAPVCGVLAAWNLLKAKANIQSGQKVLIHDASGSIGTAAVQIGRALNVEVTGVCNSANLDLVKSLGADHVIEETVEDFTKNGCSYDVILDPTGKLSFSKCKSSLTKGGHYLTTYPKLSVLLQMFWSAMIGGKKVIFSATGLRPVAVRHALLHELMPLWQDGRIKTIVDKTFPLEQMREAHRYIESGQAKGNVVVRVSELC
jgi:NADPH:quinone reductase-like Zn-dependent oxidoreductase